MNTKIFYYCDPEKNTECKKTNCLYGTELGECYACSNLKFAQDDLPSFNFVPIASEKAGFAREMVKR